MVVEAALFAGGVVEVEVVAASYTHQKVVQVLMGEEVENERVVVAAGVWDTDDDDDDVVVVVAAAAAVAHDVGTTLEVVAAAVGEKVCRILPAAGKRPVVVVAVDGTDGEASAVVAVVEGTTTEVVVRSSIAVVGLLLHDREAGAGGEVSTQTLDSQDFFWLLGTLWYVATLFGLSCCYSPDDNESNRFIRSATTWRCQCWTRLERQGGAI